MPPLKIQLAVQGGGAKLCVLMAALDAVQQLEAQGVLEVTRLAGTSAGSIGASLYAAGHNFKELRQRARDNRPYLRGIIPRVGSPVFAGMKIVAGRPLWTQRSLQILLDQLFREVRVHRFRDLKKELVILGTDLTHGQTRRYDGEEDVVSSAVLDSCAIPFFFRGPGPAGSTSWIVDGGICENLPVDALDADEKERGIHVGITFRPRTSGTTPSTFFHFSKSLLDAAMDNSVRRAQRRLGDHRLFAIDTTLDTLDFDKALDHGFDDHYSVVYQEALGFFQALVAAQAGQQPAARTLAIPEDGWESDSVTTLQKHADIFEAQHRDTKLAYQEARLVVRVEALRALSNGGSYADHPDEISYRLRFTPDRDPVYCHRVGVKDDDGRDHMVFLQTFRREVRDRSGNVVPTIDLKARDSRTGVRSYLLFFNRVLQPQDPAGPFELNYTHQIVGMMGDLVETGVDDTGLTTSRASGPIPRIILIALVPERFRVEMAASPNNTSGEPGRAMTDAEVWQTGTTVPAGYYPIGWIGENVAAGARFSVEIRYLDHGAAKRV